MDKQRRLVECDKNVDCLQSYMPILVKFYASLLLNNKPDLNSGHKMKESVRVNLAAVKSRRLNKWLDGCSSPSGMPSKMPFQEHVASYMCSLHCDYSVFHHARHFQHTGWLNVWRKRVYSSDLDGTHTQSYAPKGLGVMKSMAQYIK